MNDKYEWEQVHSSMMPNRELQPEVPAEETRRIWCEELLCCSALFLYRNV